MAQKAQLPFSKSQLDALSLPVLSAVYTDVTKNKAAADATKEQLLEELLKVADPVEEKQEATVAEKPTFKYNKVLYRVLMPKVEIPGIGIRTALEIANDTDSQKYLIENKCTGTVIEEVKS